MLLLPFGRARYIRLVPTVQHRRLNIQYSTAYEYRLALGTESRTCFRIFAQLRRERRVGSPRIVLTYVYIFQSLKFL